MKTVAPNHNALMGTKMTIEAGGRKVTGTVVDTTVGSLGTVYIALRSDSIFDMDVTAGWIALR